MSGTTILIAEDIDSNYIVLERFLLLTGARVLRARNGLEAIETVRSETSVDLVLMDMQMPVVNGYEATREILRIRPGLPVIAQTAYSIDFDEKTAMEAGCIAYTVKPLVMKDLLNLVGKILGSR